MNSDIVALCELYERRISNAASLIRFQLANLCIVADPLSLLELRVYFALEEHNIEDVAYVLKPEWNILQILPKEAALDINEVVEAVKDVHPEFEQSFVQVKMSEDSDETRMMLNLKMPPVNKERHDVIVKGADAVQKTFETEIVAEKAMILAQLALTVDNVSKEDQDAMNKTLDETTEKYKKAVADDVDKKKKDADEAYEKWQQEAAQQKLDADAIKQAANPDAAFSMKMGGE